MVVEVMGRHAGWIATYAGIAGGATEILIPEEPFSMSDLCERLLAHHNRDVSASIVVVAEGARPQGGEIITQTDQRDAFGHVRLGGISRVVADEIEARTGFETRHRRPPRRPLGPGHRPPVERDPPCPPHRPHRNRQARRP